MGVFVSFQDVHEEWTWCCQDNLVCLHLIAILTGQGHISEVFVPSQLSKGETQVLLEVVPLQTKFVFHVHIVETAFNYFVQCHTYVHTEVLLFFRTEKKIVAQEND